MLSIANCQIELKDTRAARATLESLVKTYPQSEAAQAVAKLDGSLSTEELIRGALKSMASRF